MALYTYSRWDGTQQLFPIDEEELMGLLAEQLTIHGDIPSALASLTQQGLRGRFSEGASGILEMVQSLQNMRQQLLDRYDLKHVLEGIGQRLKDIVETERSGIEKRLAEARSRRESASYMGNGASSPTPEQAEKLLRALEHIGRGNLDILDNLPPHPSGAIERLREYEFMDAQAGAKFEELLRSLRHAILKATLRTLSESASCATGAHITRMLQELNRVLESHLGGSGTEEFQQFMDAYRQLFGACPPSSVAELVEDLRRQMAGMESFLESLPPKLRNDLEETQNSLFLEEGLREELARFSSNMARFPGSLSHQGFLFRGCEQLGLEEALEVVCRLQRIGDLEGQLQGTETGDNLGGVDLELMRDLLGEESCRDLEQLRRIVEVLQSRGYIHRSEGQFELTPRGIRKIGHRALQEVFGYIQRDRFGPHPSASSGPGGDMLEEARKYEYGDPFRLHLQSTLMNAVRRGSSSPLEIRPEDFEVHQTEQSSQAATVLMLDLSLSMVMRGNFQAAKRVALALDDLIRTRFPQDSLHMVGFSTYAREIRPDRLAYLTWDEFDSYTNIQQGLAVARKLLARSPACTRQIVLVSDGEPTAHIQAGQLFLQYPPSPRTLQETLNEVRRCTRQDIRINMFMLERSPYLVEFVEQMTRINRGRVFYTSADKLGEYLLVDYMTSRRKRLA